MTTRATRTLRRALAPTLALLLLACGGDKNAGTSDKPPGTPTGVTTVTGPSGTPTGKKPVPGPKAASRLALPTATPVTEQALGEAPWIGVALSRDRKALAVNTPYGLQLVSLPSKKVVWAVKSLLDCVCLEVALAVRVLP